MKILRMVQWLMVTALLLTMAAPALAAPAPARPAPQQTNLLVNGGFESYNADGTAASWFPWWNEVANPGTGSLDYVAKPSWSPEVNPLLVHGGGSSQHIGKYWDPWHAGVRQTFTAPAGATVRVTAYGRVYASTPNFPSPSNTEVVSRMQIGADPNGGIEWYSSVVQWSGQGNPHDVWQLFSLDVVVGAAGKVTVFFSNNFRGDSRYFLDGWWDDASAVVISGGSQPPAATQPPTTGGGTTATQPPAVPPTAFVLPTPGPDGNVIYIVQEGDTLWRVAFIAGKTIDEIKTMNGLTSDIIGIGQRLIIGQGAPSVPPTNTPDPNAPTAAPTNEPAASSPTPAAPEATAPPADAGKVCALIWTDVNGNGFRDGNELLLAGGQIAVVDVATGQPVQSHITDGVNEPHCFENLPAGQYSISAAMPNGYNATTDSATSLRVDAGTTSSLQFGAQAGDALTPTTPTEDSARLRTALLGAGGVVLLLLAAGVAGFFFLRRR